MANIIITLIVIFLMLFAICFIGSLVLAKNTQQFHIRFSLLKGFEVSGSFYENNNPQEDHKQQQYCVVRSRERCNSQRCLWFSPQAFLFPIIYKFSCFLTFIPFIFIPHIFPPLIISERVANTVRGIPFRRVITPSIHHSGYRVNNFRYHTDIRKYLYQLIAAHIDILCKQNKLFG